MKNITNAFLKASPFMQVFEPEDESYVKIKVVESPFLQSYLDNDPKGMLNFNQLSRSSGYSQFLCQQMFWRPKCKQYLMLYLPMIHKTFNQLTIPDRWLVWPTMKQKTQVDTLQTSSGTELFNLVWNYSSYQRLFQELYLLLSSIIPQ